MKIVTVDQAVDLLRKGDLVGIPTETVYGLAANGLNPKAVEKIFLAKGRPKVNPLILHVSSQKMLERLIRGESKASKLLRERFWPGPLTLVYDKTDLVPEIVTAGLSTVCVRMPRQVQTLDLITKLNNPLAAPSANRSGRPSPTNLNDLAKEMPDLPAIDGGNTELGLESTVVDAREGTARVLRLGSLPIEELESVLGQKVILDNKSGKDSPGKQFKHYSPHGQVILVWPWESFGEKVAQKNNSPFSSVEEAYADCYDRYKCGIICTASREKLYWGYDVLTLGDTTEAQAADLFSVLHKTEDLGWQKIIVDMTDIDTSRGLSLTVVERLKRAAEE